MSSTFRLKVGLVATVIVIAVTVAVYLSTVMPLRESADGSVVSAVQRGNRLVTRSHQLRGYEFVDLAQTIARDNDLRKGILTTDEQKRRSHVFDALNEKDKALAGEGRKPDFFGVTNDKGEIIARDLDPNNRYGEKLSYKNVDEALQGRPAKDVWAMGNKMMRSAAAPVFHEDKVVGTVVLAYEITAREAREERDQFGADVAYFLGSTIRASSFTIADAADTEDAARVADLSRVLLGSDDAPGLKAVRTDKASEVIEVELQGERYQAIVAPLPVRLTHKEVGYVVLSSIDGAYRNVHRVQWGFMALFLFVLVMIFGAMWVVARYFVTEQDKLELGVNEVINGNMDFTFEGVREFEGLANAINVMLARLLGRVEPGEEEEGNSQIWRPDVLIIDEVTRDSSEPSLVARLGAEQIDAYFHRVFQEYMGQRQKYNMPVEGITIETLTQKLKANEAMLKAKHKCSSVRFVVKSEMGKVSFKPVLIP